MKGIEKPLTGSVSQQALDIIEKLYAVEHEARDLKLKSDEIVILRASKSKPLIDEFKALLDKNKNSTPKKSLLGKAINYALNQWKQLLVYLENGILKIDNNLAENCVRPIALGRRNWLFCGSPEGAEASAVLYSIIETAKANGLEPYRYLKFLFTEFPKTSSEEEVKALLPQYVDRNRLPEI